MFGLTKREQRWKAEQKAAETLIPLITTIAVEAMRQDDKDAEITRLRAELAQAMKERSRAIAAGSDMEQEVERLRDALATIIEKRDTYGWSPEADAAIDAARGTT